VTQAYDHPDVSTSQTLCWRLQLPTCQLNWGYSKTSDGQSLDSWATSNNLWLLYDPKETASSSSHRWNVDTNPHLALVSLGQDKQLPDRRGLGKFPWAQHRPSLITTPTLKVPVCSDPMRAWNFRKADFCLLTGQSVE